MESCGTFDEVALVVGVAAEKLDRELAVFHHIFERDTPLYASVAPSTLTFEKAIVLAYLIDSLLLPSALRFVAIRFQLLPICFQISLGASAVKITKRTVDAVKPASADTFVWDDELKGFGLRVLASGRKVVAHQALVLLPDQDVVHHDQRADLIDLLRKLVQLLA